MRSGISFTEEGVQDVALLSGHLAFFLVAEPYAGVDLNGDGDASDFDVLHARNLGTGATRNLGVSTPGDVGLAAGRGLLFRTRESSEGNQDLNGDGDLNDTVIRRVEVRL